jgi:hypothetical protein
MESRINQTLDKKINFNGEIKTWREFVTSQNIELSDGDGMIDWNRTKFNRMNYKEQKEYEDKLKSKKYYYVNGYQCPKIVWDYAQSIAAR